MILSRVDIIVLYKIMDYQTLQSQYDKIYFYFRTTCEPFDVLEWDGKVLQVWKDDLLVEMYHQKDLNFMLGSN